MHIETPEPASDKHVYALRAIVDVHFAERHAHVVRVDDLGLEAAQRDRARRHYDGRVLRVRVFAKQGSSG